MMITFSTIEDYIEVIAGERDPVTSKPTNSWLSDPIISLARYDTDVVTKMSTQTMGGTGYTEKQAKLAHKIVLTYKRQLAQKNIDVSAMENPVYRLPVRQMDYTMSLYIEDHYLCLKFPYNQKLIESVRLFNKESQGRTQWNPDKKVWQIELTEYNLNWANVFASVNNFVIDPEVTALVAKITDVENNGFEICLTLSDGKLTIDNAADSLIEYIEQHVGSMSPDNLLNLVDYSDILGYTVDSDITSALTNEYGHKIVQLLTHRELKLDPQLVYVDNNFEEIVNYATQVDRLPVYIYEPDLSGKLLNKAQELFSGEEILVVKHTSNLDNITDKTKVVHITKPVKDRSVPILISSAGMIYGGEKEVMVQRAQKIIYCAAEVYNKKSNSGVKAFAS